MPYSCRKLGKMSQNLTSAAVVIGALRVKSKEHFSRMSRFYKKHKYSNHRVEFNKTSRMEQLHLKCMTNEMILILKLLISPFGLYGEYI